MAAHRLVVAVVCLFAAGPAWAQSPAPPPASRKMPANSGPKLEEPYPLTITITGPKEFHVDELVAFEVQVCNTGNKALEGKRLKVEVATFALPVFPGGRANNPPVPLDDLKAAALSENAVRGPRLLNVKALAAGESQKLSLKFTFRRDGDSIVLRVGEPEFFQDKRGWMSASLGAPESSPPVVQEKIGAFKVAKVSFDPKTPLRDILPPPPKTTAGPPKLPAGLDDVPELSLQEHVKKFAQNDESLVQMLRTIGRINLLNDKKTDSFIETLAAHRPDLAGLPFVLGDACRPSEERGRQFGLARLALHKARFGGPSTEPTPSSAKKLPPPGTSQGNASDLLSPSGNRVTLRAGSADLLGTLPGGEALSGMANMLGGGGPQAGPGSPRDRGERLLENFRTWCLEAEKNDKRLDPRTAEHAAPARVAALMQILGPEPAVPQLALVKHLAATSHVEATRALAKLVLFSEEAEVRNAAALALQTRRERDYDDLLLEGLRYPWPTVARRASDAIITLERTDLIPKLLDVLDRPDPRLPQVQERAGKKVTVMRELVRVNHHRNCLLCHPPIDDNVDNVAADKADTLDMLFAPVPLADQELPRVFPASGNYDDASVEIAVRLDATYLKQDFSLKLPVMGAAPWPEMQRFDFLVRTRELSDEEAAAYRKLLAPSRPGAMTHYHAAALFALRELTGLDTEPNAQAWRKLLANSSGN